MAQWSHNSFSNCSSLAAVRDHSICKSDIKSDVKNLPVWKTRNDVSTGIDHAVMLYYKYILSVWVEKQSYR